MANALQHLHMHVQLHVAFWSGYVHRGIFFLCVAIICPSASDVRYTGGRTTPQRFPCDLLAGVLRDQLLGMGTGCNNASNSLWTAWREEKSVTRV